MLASPAKVGVIGCGNISGVYLKNAQTFEALEIITLADLVPERALTQAVECGVGRANNLDQVLSDPEVDIVLNLTTPRAHVGITLAALFAGKSVYSEKPLAIDRADGQRILDTARTANLRVGCAPDTFLGAGLQTARKLLDEGVIGAPVAATAFMLCHGPERWHPNPDYFYKLGGGPLFDMGPYYLTALVHLLGPVHRVCAAARVSFPSRTIASAPKQGQTIDVEVPTHVAGVLEFASGPLATLVTSFDVWHATAPHLELYGTDGSLALPDPNAFGGPLRLRRSADETWTDVPLTFEYAGNCRGLGLADLAHALRTDRPHRASGELAFHVLDIMQALQESADSRQHVELASTCERPAPMVAALTPGRLDD